MTKRAGAVSEETRAKLIQAAKDEFEENGFQKASLRKICARAGVTTGALYFFFEGKDDLFSTIVESVTVPITKLFETHYADEKDISLADLTGYDWRNEMEAVNYLLDFYHANKQSVDIVLANREYPMIKEFLDNFTQVTEQHYSYVSNKLAKELNLGHPVDPYGVHWHSHMEVESMLSLLQGDFTREETLLHAETVVRMLVSAFIGLLSE